MRNKLSQEKTNKKKGTCLLIERKTHFRFLLVGNLIFHLLIRIVQLSVVVYLLFAVN